MMVYALMLYSENEWSCEVRLLNIYSSEKTAEEEREKIQEQIKIDCPEDEYADCWIEAREVL